MKIEHFDHLLQGATASSLIAQILSLFQRHPYRRFSIEDISDQTQALRDQCSPVLDHLILLGLLEGCEEGGDIWYKADCSGAYWGALDGFLRDAGYALNSSPVPSAPAVFLDRDGVINEVVIRNGTPLSPRTISEFEWADGVKEALKGLKHEGFLLIVVSNQPDIARGKMSRETLDAMTEMVYSATPVNAVWICPHDDGDGCNCRKPKPGMLLDAAQRWGIDCSRSFMVGDSWKDMEAGYAAGCTAIILDRAHNKGVTCDHRLPSLKEAVDLILKLNKENT